VRNQTKLGLLSSGAARHLGQLHLVLPFILHPGSWGFSAMWWTTTPQVLQDLIGLNETVNQK